MSNFKCLVISLDYDGCTDTPFSQQPIIDHISILYSQFPSIQKIVFLIGSLRQSLHMDISNALRNSTYPNFLSCTRLIDEILPGLKTHLDEKFPENMIEIIFDTFLQADVYADLDSGTTFSSMQKVFSTTPPEIFQNYGTSNFEEVVQNQKGENINLISAPHWVDCSKITIIYAQLHHIATHYPDSSCLMHFYDDRQDILGGIEHFFRSNPRWVPNNMILKLFTHKALPHHIPVSFGGYMIGYSEINTNYRNLLLQLANIFSWTSIPSYFGNFSNYFEEAFKSKEYSNNKIPRLVKINEQDVIISFQTNLQEAQKNLDMNINLDCTIFNDYLNKLEFFENNEELFDIIYKKDSILQNQILSKKDCQLLNKFDDMLLNYPENEYEYEYQEAYIYAKKRYLFEQRIASYKIEFNILKQKLVDQILSKLNISEEVLLDKINFYNKPTETIIAKPKPRRATPTQSLSFFDNEQVQKNELESESLNLKN